MADFQHCIRLTPVVSPVFFYIMLAVYLTSVMSSAILSTLSNRDVAEDPVSRYLALSSLICALISLLFGCMYIIRFGSMRKTYRAAEWALVSLNPCHGTSRYLLHILLF